MMVHFYTRTLCLLALLSSCSLAEKTESADELKDKWGTDWAFSGISTFGHLPHVHCLTRPDEYYDIAIIGVPFDTAVSYRPGARFGPRALRAASARILPWRGYNARAELDPFSLGLKITDCGDMPITPFDNALALRQMTEGYLALGSRPAHASAQRKPKLITLGGDHSLALPALRALHKIHGQPITVVHLDAHLDTWDPAAYPSAWLDPNVPIAEQQSAFTHGSMFWLAWNEGLLSPGPGNASGSAAAPRNVHAGLRTRLRDDGDNASDAVQGWLRIASDDIAADLLGPRGVAERILAAVGTEAPVYLSVDIDVLDPGIAPGTGTPEPGGWSTRELVRVLRALGGLNVVGADLVEVSPGFDGAGEQTALAGAQVVYEILTSMARRVDSEREGLAKEQTSQTTRDEL